jgi:hypothetical protein
MRYSKGRGRTSEPEPPRLAADAARQDLELERRLRIELRLLLRCGGSG